MKYIQSFYQYPVTFSSIAKTMPARGAKGELRNIAEVTEAQLDILQKAEPLFRELVNKKKYRVLNHLPESYKASNVRINEANDEIARLRAENERLKAAQSQSAEKPTVDNSSTEDKSENNTVDLDKLTYKELQEKAKELGIDYKNVKKSDLIAKIKEAQ